MAGLGDPSDHRARLERRDADLVASDPAGARVSGFSTTWSVSSNVETATVCERESESLRMAAIHS